VVAPPFPLYCEQKLKNGVSKCYKPHLLTVQGPVVLTTVDT